MSQSTSDSDGFLTIGCLARGFSPADSLTFKWKDPADKELSDFVQYPAFGRDGDYTKISHMRVRKSELDPQKPYKCEASTSQGTKKTSIPPPIHVNKPTIALLSREDGDSIVLECQLNDYFPDKLTVQWLEGDKSVKGQIDKKFQNTEKGEKNYTYISQLPISAPYEDKTYTCKATHNSEEFKKEYNMCKAQSLFKPSVQIKRAHLRDIILESKVTVSCVVEAPVNTKVSWLTDNVSKTAPKEVKDPSNNIVSNLTLSRDEWLALKTIVCTAKHPCFPEQKVEFKADDIKTDPVVEIRSPLMKSAQENSTVLECVVNGLSSGEVCITFQANNNDRPISDISCVDWAPSENIWPFTTHFTIPSEHQKNGKVFTCKVHRLFKSWTSQPTGNIFAPPPELRATVYLTVPTKTELENGKATFMCVAQRFSPKTYVFKWVQDGKNVTNVIDKYDKSEMNGSVTEYSATSILQITAEQWKQNSKVKCQFEHKAGNEEKEVEYTDCGGEIAHDIEPDIVPPSTEDMLKNRVGLLKCKASAENTGFTKITIKANNNIIANNSPDEYLKNNKTVELDAPIGYEEWSNGTEFTCTVEHSELAMPKSTKFVRENGKKPKRPSVFIIAPPEHNPDEPMTLTCYVKDFYPKEVFVSWLVNDEPLPSEYSYSTSQPIKNGQNFSVYSQLTVANSKWKSGTVFSCVVYHEGIDDKMRVLTRSIDDNMEKAGVINLSMNTPASCKD